MDKNIINHIASDLKELQFSVIRIANKDDFLSRKDVVSAFSAHSIVIVSGSSIQQRIAYELRDLTKYLILTSKYNTGYLDDILINSSVYDFKLENYIQGFHKDTVINEGLDIINKLYNTPQIINLNKNETNKYILKLKENKNTAINKIEWDSLHNKLNNLLVSDEKDWKNVIQLLSFAIMNSIKTMEFDAIYDLIKKFNISFQEHLSLRYSQLKNSNPIKNPLIVSKILDHINMNHKDDKVALIVIDGMAYWQYLILKEKINNKYLLKEEFTHAWIPSITQLSRQAIFRGDKPVKDYSQNPDNEKKIWTNYWLSKGFSEYCIRYNHNSIDLESTDNILKFGIVYTELDNKMHASTNYADLIDLTKNWIEGSDIIETVNSLLEKDFTVYVTTDHGNIQSRGWRGLKGKEKLGTNKSGSRSERHIEYSEQSLADEFLETNPEISSAIIKDNKMLYFNNDLSFSNSENLITHGGSHILEILIPFIQIRHDK